MSNMQLFKTFITYLLSTLLKLKITRTALETIKLDNNYPVSIQTILNIYHTCLASVHTQTFTHLHIFVISTHTHTHTYTHICYQYKHTHTHTHSHMFMATSQTTVTGPSQFSITLPYPANSSPTLNYTK